MRRMTEFAKTMGKMASSIPGKRQFKYPSEDEHMVRRLGSAVLSLWSGLPPDIQQQLLSEANLVWDREYGVSGLPGKLETFIKRHPGRIG
jgi:hypothetical protein